jgi:P-type E1-E2 ATPase
VWLGANGIDVNGLAASPSATDAEAGQARIFVGIDGRAAGVIVMADQVRAEAARVVSGLRALGVGHVAMLSGDDRAVAEAVGRVTGVDEVVAGLDPAQKVDALLRLRDRSGARPIVMVGDGVNDAPALAAADVGVALAGDAGTTIAAETADVVITVDRFQRVLEAAQLARRSLRIARQSVVVGMALSFAAMAVAAAGHLTPLGGALLQEGIDVAVIANALRAVRG